MWGVYKFKEGLGGKVVRTIGAWDYPVKRNLYTLFVQIMPRVLAIMRRRGMARHRPSFLRLPDGIEVVCRPFCQLGNFAAGGLYPINITIG